ncbi:hypothetical protein Bca4012_043785 [Brassica carinata]
MSIDDVVLLSIDFWSTLSIAVAWRVSIDTSLVDLRIMRESVGFFFEELINHLFIVVLDEITFSEDLLKEDIYQELKDISESTNARLGMQQRNIGNLQHRMNASEVARERLKNKWTRGDEAIRSFIGTWFQMSEEDIDNCFPTSSHPPPY